MRRNFRDRLLLGLLASSTAVACSRLTAIDWSQIPAASTGGSSVGGNAAGGADAGESSGGKPDASAEAGAGGAAGAAGAGGEASGGEGAVDQPPGMFIEGSGGNAGSTGGGTGGVAGTGGGGGMSGGGSGGDSPAGCTPSACTGTTGPLTNAMVLYAAPTKTNGARGGRTGMDAACETERVRRGLTQTTTRAFISIDPTSDFIANWQPPEGSGIVSNLPLNQRIVGPTGIEIATRWADLVDGSIEQSLVCAKVVPDGTDWWLAGNQVSCAFSAGTGITTCGVCGTLLDTCKGWTLGDHDQATFARPGSAVCNDGHFLSAADTKTAFIRVSCDKASQPSLCLAYTP